jgi:pimeloyl-ACP methyl ester carboxylesterase
VNGLPCVKVGDGKEKLVVFTSGSPDTAVPAGRMLKIFADGAKTLAEQYTVYFVKRRQRLPVGYTTVDMAHDYAELIRHELAEPCHVIGISAGGFVAEQFAVIYSEWVKKLVIAIAGYRLTGRGRQIVLEWRELAAQNRLYKLLVSMYRSTTNNKLMNLVAPILAAVIGRALKARVSDLGDFVVTLDALLAHDAWDVLPEIRAPTLIVGGQEDVFYPAETLREMSARIPHARLLVYPGVGHGALEFRKKQFDRDVLAFLSSIS